MSPSSYRDLEIYQTALSLAVELEGRLREFPQSQRHRVVDQMARSSTAIGAHIAEGWGRKTSIAEFKRYLRMALGEIQETKYWVEFSTEVGLWSREEGRRWWRRYDELAAQTYRAVENWKEVGFSK